MRKIKILDCTLRDGGYVNKWNFGKDKIKNIVNKLTEADIDIIECGFLNDKEEYDDNHSIYNKINKLNEVLNKNNSSMYVCMVNYGEYDLNNFEDNNELSKKLGIRVAFHKKDLSNGLEFCEEVISKGYQVFVQPMITINYSDKELLYLVEKCNEMGAKALYIVDSFGSMQEKDVVDIFKFINKLLNNNISIGFHSHNNLQLAYSNAKKLLEFEIDREIIVDTSIFGMGRGAGNLNTELFATYLNKNFNKRYKIESLLDAIEHYINIIYMKSPWGYSIPYYISATNSCHPNYATYLLDKHTLTINEINYILNNIDENEKYNFNKQYIAAFYTQYQTKLINDEEELKFIKTLLEGKIILLLVPGMNVNLYKEEISKIIMKTNPFVISVNFVHNYFESNAIFINNNIRITQKLKEIISNNDMKKIITSNVLKQNENEVKNSYILNYHELINEDDDIMDNATLMILKLLTKLNVNDVYLAGFDGFDVDKDNHIGNYTEFGMSKKTLEKINMKIKNQVEILKKNLNLKFITPSIYDNSDDNFNQ